MDSPTIEIDEDMAERIRQEFGAQLAAVEETGVPLVEEQPAPKRGRGRPRLPRDQYGNIIKGQAPTSTSSEYSSLPKQIAQTVPAAPLTRREEKQVAERLQNILEGITGVVGVANPIFAMREDEARAIAEPLSSYLIRMEPSSRVAREILDQYDLVAVAAGAGAYSVRVYLDLKKEREVAKNVVKESGLEPIRKSSRKMSANDGDGNKSTEEPAGQTRYVGPISSPTVEGDGVFPRI